MADYEVTFNVYNGGSSADPEKGFDSGHANVTFSDNTRGFHVTVGANTSFGLAGLNHQSSGPPDGFIQIEDELYPKDGGSVVSRSVPVTQEQFEIIAPYAENLGRNLQEYDYALIGNAQNGAQTCANWAQAVYEATGHPGVVGDLFSITDREKVPSLVWVYVGVTTMGIPRYTPSGPIEGHVPDVSGLIPDGCFLPGTPISLWSGGIKPIEAVTAGDMVVSYDRAGRLVPGRVARTFVNEARQVLDVFGLMVTPGHVTLCGDGPFAGRHVPMMDILRSDGALVMEDGSLVRAATGCAVGSEGDWWVTAIVGERQADGTVEVAEVGRIRAGTRAITAEGEDVSVLDLIRAAGATLGEDGLIRTAEGGAGLPFRWTFSATLPKPEDYVLQRSATTLGDVYAAGEWEGVAPRMAAPVPVTSAVSEAEAPMDIQAAPVNVPLALRDGGHPGAFAPARSRRERRAAQARARKAEARQGARALH